MAYVSLYRRYRPGTFADVVGQEHVIRTLVNAIQEDRLSHAYLFTGPRGTGKTSTARILAKALNCESGPTPEPCGSCGQCVAIAEGSSVDVIELDMASHGGVDDARELRDRALFAPASARRKVYILDEVHMASTAAFNALLKLIEEPPAHVLFAMATTDPQKVLPTILSRVQRLDLRRVSAVEVAAHVRSICATEGYTIDDGAVDAVVRAGDGSVRDTLSVLEQVLAFAGREVTADAVDQTLGATAQEALVDLVDLVAARDLPGLFGVVQRLLDQGTDLRRFTLDLVQHVRDLLVLQVAPDRPDLVDATDERRRRLLAQCGALPRDTLLRAADILAATLAEQRQGSPRLPLELALAQLTITGADGDVAELTDRIARLEATLGGGSDAAAAQERATSRTQAPPVDPVPPAAPDVPTPDVAVTPPADVAPPAEPHVPDDPTPDTVVPTAPVPADSDPLGVLVDHWEGVLERLKQGSRRHHAMVEPALPVSLARGILTLRYGARYASFHAVQARTGELDAAIREAIAAACGLRVKLEVVIEGDDERRRPVPPSVTPDDARTPVLDTVPIAQDPSAPVGSPTDEPDTGDRPDEGPEVSDEGSEVREAELGRVDEVVDVDELLATELDARLVEERPAAGAGEG